MREYDPHDEIELPMKNKGIYTHLADFCDNMNIVIDICNGRDGAHTPENAVERQALLLEKMQYFFEWKELHDKRVAADEATEYNFFAEETWFCLRALILVHVALIQEYCIKKRVSINPKSLNTDVCEWFFGDGRQMVGGATNKLTAVGWNNADRKSGAFSAGRHGLVGNNASGENTFKRQKRSAKKEEPKS